MINNILIVVTLGIFVVILISFLVIKMSKKNNKIKPLVNEKELYDERQISSRMLAYKYGFISFTICLFTLFFVLFLCMTFLGYIPEICSPLVLIGIVIFIGEVTFCITAIWNDAFISFRKSKTNTNTFNIIFFLVLGVIALVNAIYRTNIPTATITATLSFIASLFCITVAVNIMIKSFIDNKKEKEE